MKFSWDNSDNYLALSLKPFIPVDWALTRFYLVKEALQSGKYVIKPKVDVSLWTKRIQSKARDANEEWILMGVVFPGVSFAGNWMSCHGSTHASISILVQQPSVLSLDWCVINSACIVIARAAASWCFHFNFF